MEYYNRFKDWASQEFGHQDLWCSRRTAQDLSANFGLRKVREDFHLLNRSEKLGVLLSLVHMRKDDIYADGIQEILNRASQDDDEWVKFIGVVLQQPLVDPTTLEASSAIWTELLNRVGTIIEEQGQSFRPEEFALLRKEVRDAQYTCPVATDTFKSDKLTLKHHFTLKSDQVDHDKQNDRQVRFDAILQRDRQQRNAGKPDMRPGLHRRTSSNPNIAGRAVPPTMQAPTRYPGQPMQARPTVRPPVRPPVRPASRSTPAASLFIKAPRQRAPSGQGPAAVATGLPSFLLPNRPAVQSPTTPTERRPGFQRESRTQMIDFNDASLILEDNNRSRTEAEQNWQAKKEQKKQEMLEARRQSRTALESTKKRKKSS
ncbi:hypothetical protein BCR43DRAFT_492778 [Syncephalastrum racemosum]|uniref:Uncharacterized protein n=1 Tax=Syncephalastrum racemosum TaxID=13706 RepID=A0A1X2H9I6_SYNRA|nr:hypothetical protein BCR43DRAFT_492778 [Syncephalastrum racemosum]